jgi:hypothetical protein
MSRILIAIVLGVAALASACSSGDDGASSATDGGSSSSQGGSGSNTGSAGGSGSSGGATTAEATVKLTGGSDAGEYKESVNDAGCSYGLIGKDSFGIQFSKDKPSGFSSLQLIVPSTTDAKDGSENFLTTVTIGPILGDNRMYEVETRTSEQASASGIGMSKGPAGKGTVKIDDKGNTAKVDIDATTADGVHIQASVDCKSVIRF